MSVESKRSFTVLRKGPQVPPPWGSGKAGGFVLFFFSSSYGNYVIVGKKDGFSASCCGNLMGNLNHLLLNYRLCNLLIMESTCYCKYCSFELRAWSGWNCSNSSAVCETCEIKRWICWFTLVILLRVDICCLLLHRNHSSRATRLSLCWFRSCCCCRPNVFVSIFSSFYCKIVIIPSSSILVSVPGVCRHCFPILIHANEQGLSHRFASLSVRRMFSNHAPSAWSVGAGCFSVIQHKDRISYRAGHFLLVLYVLMITFRFLSVRSFHVLFSRKCIDIWKQSTTKFGWR